MRMKGKIFLRTSAWLALSIAALTIAVTAFSYSGSGNRETVRTLARSFFVQLWKGSQARATAKNAVDGATPQGRIIQ
jgi:hypothetical protein